MFKTSTDNEIPTHITYDNTTGIHSADYEHSNFDQAFMKAYVRKVENTRFTVTEKI